MIEFITSKAVGAVVAVVLLGAIAGFFEVQRASVEEQQFWLMCDSLARAIDGVSSANAVTAINVTFGPNGSGLRLDFSFRNKGYDIEIRAGQVIFRQGGLTAVRALTRSVHPWDPKLAGNGTTLHVSEETLSWLDGENPVLKVPSGKDLVIESRPVAAPGQLRFGTFVHF